MSALVEVGLSNAVAAMVLAVVALLAGLCRLRPAVVHALWLLVLLKLVTPPLVRIPVPLSAPAAAAEPAGKPAEETPPPPVEEPFAPDNNDVIALPPLREELIVRADGDGGDDADVVTMAALPPAVAFPWAEWLAGTWAAGAVLWFGVAWLRLWRFGRLLRHGQNAPEAVLRRVRRLSKRLDLEPPRVRMLPGRLAPMIWGLGRPLLLLPEGLEAEVGTEGLDTLLLHELSHLKRGDHHVRWLEFVALGLYWWLPVAWYARRELREAEEQCCDAWVVRTMPGSRRLYATALVEALDFLSQPVTATPPLASALGEVADLKRRLTLIMRGTTPHLLGRPFGLAVFGLAFTVLPLVPGLGLGQPPPPVQERKDVIRFVDNEDSRKLQEEIRRKKEEIEALARKLEKAAREQAEMARTKSRELRDKIRRDVEVRLADVAKRKGNVIRIEIVGEAMKPEELKSLSNKIKELVPGENRKVTVTVGGPSIHFVRPTAPKLAEAPRVPNTPRTPEPPRAPEAGQRGPRGDGDRRLDHLERRLEGIMKELESLRKEMRGPNRRQGFGDGFGGGFGRRDPGVAPKEAPRSRERERQREQDRTREQVK